MSISGSSWLKFGLFTVGLGQSFVFVLVPPLARDLGLSVIQTSSIFAISALAWALTSAFWGRASDKYGRRNIAILGLIGYAVSLIALITPLFLAEKNILNITLLFPALVLGRLINGLLGSATRPATFAYMADITSKDDRTTQFARLESSFLVGTVAGPLIGGFLFLISNETPFYVFSFLGFIAACGIYLNLEKPNHIKATNNNHIKISWMPAMYMRTYNIGIDVISIWLGSAFLIAGPIGAISTGWLGDYLLNKCDKGAHLKLFGYTMIVLTIAATLVPLMPSYQTATLMFVPQCLMAAGQTALAPLAIVNITPNQLRGQVVAIYFFVISMTGYTLGPTSVALLTDFVFQDEALITYSISTVSLVVGIIGAYAGFKGVKHYREYLSESDAD